MSLHSAVVSWIRRRGWEIALLGITVIWGATFPIVKCSIERCPDMRWGLGLATVSKPTTPFMFLGLRFTVAALILMALAPRIATRLLLPAAVAGLALFAGYAFQTAGLQRTSASNAGFITGLFVVLVPLFGAVLVRKAPSPAAATGVVLATAGLFLLSSPSGIHLGAGDAMVLGAAASFSVHILLTSRLAPRADPRSLVAVQMAVAAIASLLWTGMGERTAVPTQGALWGAVLITGILASALAFIVQTRAQRDIAPTRTAVILTMEPVFAGLFGLAMLSEHLGARGYAGAALILAGILVAETLAPAREAV